MKTLYRITLIIIALFTIFACSKPEIEATHLKVDTQEIVFQNCSDLHIVKVEAAQEPSVETPDWISFTTVKESHLKWKFYFTSQKNETTEQRENKLTYTNAIV